MISRWKNTLQSRKLSGFLLCAVMGMIGLSLWHLCAISEYKGTVSGKVKESGKIYHASYRSDPELYAGIYAGVQGEEMFEEKVYGGIAPHHFLAARLIAKFYKKLEAQKGVETVILVGPNHFQVGFGGALSSKAYWDTPFGEVAPDAEFIDELVREDLIRVEEKPFAGEHSVSVHMPFLRKTFPGAKVVPLILKEDIGYDTLDRIAEKVHERYGEKALIIASVDFSHGLSLEKAQMQDAESVRTITSFGLEEVPRLGVDSPASLYLLLRYLEDCGTRKLLFSERSNSALLDISGGSGEDTVGHFIGHFGR
jgi:AmmeMemoRadiSam system protein B